MTDTGFTFITRKIKLILNTNHTILEFLFTFSSIQYEQYITMKHELGCVERFVLPFKLPYFLSCPPSKRVILFLHGKSILHFNTFLERSRLVRKHMKSLSPVENIHSQILSFTKRSIK